MENTNIFKVQILFFFLKNNFLVFQKRPKSYNLVCLKMSPQNPKPNLNPHSRNTPFLTTFFLAQNSIMGIF